MGRPKTLTSATRDWLNAQDWIDPLDPLITALLITARAADENPTPSTMATYAKLKAQLERQRPDAGQAPLVGAELLGPLP